MDTPDRSQIGSSIRGFEDSPVFNYLNSLSPIKPVKSVHITQTFNSLSFPSPPSVFTSPHVTFHKDSRSLKGHHFKDASKSDNSHDDGQKNGKSEVISIATQFCDDAVSVVTPIGPSNPVNDFPQSLQYNFSIPNCNTTTYCGVESDSVVALSDSSTAPAPHHQVVSENVFFESQRACIEQKKKNNVCDWESLISDSTELLNFDSPNDTETHEGLIHNSQDQSEYFYCSNISQVQKDDGNCIHKEQLVCSIDSCEQDKLKNPSNQPEEAREMKFIDRGHGKQAISFMRKCTTNSLNEKIDNEHIPNLHRGIRKRCLDFEMGGGRKKILNNVCSSSSSMFPQCDEEMTSVDRQLVPVTKPSGDTSRPILPGIGLHLNALALTPRNLKVSKHENFANEKQLIPDEEFHAKPSVERNTNAPITDVKIFEDASQESIAIATENINQNSPKKKKSELSVEHEACKRCNCKRSKCLKLYCECFAAGVYCIEPCSCQECFNKPLHEDTVLATRKSIETRNPLAFAPKVVRTSDSLPEIGDESSQTPASARHKRGCNCKKSSCLKKYCECYQGGVGCSINCRCEGCKNAFGRKDGSVLLETDAEPAGEGAEKLEKIEVDKKLQKPFVQKNKELNPDSSFLATPLNISRLSSSMMPCSSKSKLHRSFTVGGSSFKPQNSQNLQSLPYNEKQIRKNDTPEILQGNITPISCIKSGSPNSKRVSPPHYDKIGPSSSSPSGLRSSRKLILRSIPSFPSLTPQP